MVNDALNLKISSAFEDKHMCNSDHVDVVPVFGMRISQLLEKSSSLMPFTIIL